MRQRCNNQDDSHYPDYGGRGIKICKRWDKFEAFETDMGPQPDGTSLDRIDNEGGYTPDNCRWATAKTQARNRRGNFLITADGATRTAAEWSERLGGNLQLVQCRVRQLGWSEEDAVLTPIGKPKGTR